MADEIETISYIDINGNMHPIDAVTVNGKSIPDNSYLLPNLSSADNGKVLRVVNGRWTLVEPAIIFSGTGSPDDTDGKDGDIYIQTETEIP